VITNENKNDKGYISFLHTVIDVSDLLTLPYQLDDNHRFSRTPSKLEGVHYELCEIIAKKHVNVYEHEWVECSQEGFKGWESKPLPTKKHRYFSIQTINKLFEIESYFLAQILSIHNCPLYFPAHAVTSELWGEGIANSTGRKIEIPSIDKYSNIFYPTLTVQHLNFAKLIWEQYKSFSKNAELSSFFKKFSSLLSMHDQSFAISYLSPLKIIAQFAVLESALTHKPKAHIITDSLTHQICKKLMLLSNRPNVYVPQIKGEQLDKTWKRLYDIRSSIVHGEIDSQWVDSKLQGAELINCLHSSDFVAATVRAVLRAILFEPEVVFSLKEV
jgi:Apea-like HEPN